MKKMILLLLITFPIYGQNSELITDEELCGQIESAIQYLKTDRDLKTRNFRFGSRIGNGYNYNMFFPIEYVAHQLDVEKEKIFVLDENKTNPIFKKLEITKRKISKLELDCVKIKRKPNTELSKLDKDNLLINVTTNRVGKEGANGVAYLFFFKNDEISAVYKTSWID
jgi:hypothetical protein